MPRPKGGALLMVEEYFGSEQEFEQYSYIPFWKVRRWYKANKEMALQAVLGAYSLRMRDKAKGIGNE